jgi:hypothetical protein
MNFRLGGASAKAPSKQQVLAQAEAQRQARSEARQQQKAAVTIQRAWRGTAARAGVRAQRLQAWTEQFGGVAAALHSSAGGPGSGAPPMTAAELRGATALLLSALLPPPASAARRRIALGHPLVQQPAQRRALAGLTSLLARSLKCDDPSANYLAASGSTDAARPQAQRLCLLYCASIAACGDGGAGDLVLDAALARTVELMLLPQGTGPGSGGAAAESARAALLASVVARPLPLLGAARRLTAQIMAAAAAGGSGGSPAQASSKVPSSINATSGGVVGCWVCKPL